MIIDAIRNYVIFTFVEDILSGRFVNNSGGAIILTSDDKAQTTYPRWGHVTNIGPDVRDVKVGDYILIEPGKWTSHFYVDEKRFWKTDDSMILCTADEPGSTY